MRRFIWPKYLPRQQSGVFQLNCGRNARATARRESGGQGDAMSPLTRNLIVYSSFVAFVMGAARMLLS